MDKFGGQKMFLYKDLTDEHLVDEECREVCISCIETAMIRYRKKHGGVLLRRFKPVSRDYKFGLFLWKSNGSLRERYVWNLYGEYVDSLLEELNNTFGGPNYEGVVNGEAMWWRDMNDIEST